MEHNKPILNTVPELLKATYGDKIKEKIFQNLAGNAELREFLRDESIPFSKLMSYYRCAIMEVETKFRVLNEEFSLEHDRNPIESIKSRLKSPESIMEKMARKGIPFSADNIEANLFDIAGLRIICSFKEDIYFLEKCLLQQDDITLIRRKDYIENPKENGYRSLHLIVEVPIFLKNEKRLVKVEIQLRTIAMDFWASLEHKLKYKKELAQNIDKNEITQELKDCALASAELDARMDMIRKKMGY